MKLGYSLRNILAAFVLGTCLGMGSNYADFGNAKTFVLRTILVFHDSGSNRQDSMK